jgi:hypothetical protein
MNSYQKFLGAAFQMLVTIVAGVFAGRYLDAYFFTDKPWSVSYTHLTLPTNVP